MHPRKKNFKSKPGRTKSWNMYLKEESADSKITCDKQKNHCVNLQKELFLLTSTSFQ